ncbi:MAG: hypothetical protein H8E43_09655 [Planctomycetia bacterium]|nr:hypothetical protein [Planctomycetia bacterium]MBL6915873.1 hypothetical protein [Planctomycetota bacterium]
MVIITPSILVLVFSLLAASGESALSLSKPATESDFYEVVNIPIPDGVGLEVGGLVSGPGKGVIYASTRRGDIWKIEDAYGPAPKFTRFSDGLQEPLGLCWHDDWLYTVQRGELSRLKDEDGDGRADVLETVCDDWTISGNYHEYAFGPRVDKEGNFWITLNKPFGAEPFGRQHWRGWAIKVGEDGRMIPAAGGLRSPAGVEVSPAGDVFYTDNQGEWCGTNKLCHIEDGDYFGHVWGVESAKLPISRMEYPGETPNGLTYVEARKQIPFLKLPAVWFPYDKMGKSAAGMVWDTTEGGFGPFADQLLVTDQHHASVMRVDLEKVNGVWQGAAMRFRENLDCGALRTCWGDNDVLLVGQTNRGWGSRGKKTEGLAYLRWTGKVPVEVLTCRATADGYRMTFTVPMDRATLEDVATYQTENYTYKLHEPYGSPEVDRQDVKVTSAIASEDGLSVELKLEGPGAMRIGYVTEFRMPGLKTTEGESLLHAEVYATLNEKP